MVVLALLNPSAESVPIPQENEKRAFSSIVTGTPMGFASATTGGGIAAVVYPTTIEELIFYLTSDEPQNIEISGKFNFQGSEGSQFSQPVMLTPVHHQTVGRRCLTHSEAAVLQRGD